MNVTLLGPQRRVAGARAAVAELVPDGPVATINAGWREREADTAELDLVLGGRMLNLGLHRRWLHLVETDPAYAEAERALQAQLGDLRAAYQLRLRHGLAAVRAVSQRVGDEAVRAAARDDAVAGVRALDTWHVERSNELRQRFYAEVGLGERASVEQHRREIAGLVGDSAGMVVAGGHVGVLLHLLHLFGVVALLKTPLVTWSAGAMALSPRVVLFGDHAPYGHSSGGSGGLPPGVGTAPEVYAEGLGAYAHGIPFPHARRRLRLNDPEHIGLLAERLDPYPALRLDDGVRLDLVDGRPLPEQAARLGAAS